MKRSMSARGARYRDMTRVNISIEVSNSSGTTSLAPSSRSASISLRKRVRVMMCSDGFIFRARSVTRRVAAGSETTMASTRARSIPACSSTAGWVESP